MPSYLRPMTLLRLVLVGYRLVRSGPYACLSSMYVQNLHAAHAFVVVGLYSLPSVLDHFLVSLSFMACPIQGWALLDGGLCFFFSPPFFQLPSPAIQLYHSCCDIVLPQSGWASLELPFILLLMAQQGHWFFCYITDRLLCLTCFLLNVPGLFASLGLPQPFS